MSPNDTYHDDSNALGPAAPEEPMVITSTSYAADVVTVRWQPVNYKDGEGFVIAIITGASKMNNFQIGNPRAVSNEVDFTCEPGGVYSVLVEPIIRGRPKDSLSSAPVPIPYPVETPGG